MSSARIKVAVRIRPFLESETRKGYQNTKLQVDKNNKELHVNIDQNNNKAFKFDYLFEETTTQSELYHGCNIDQLVDKAIEGYHSTIFAYGQTGSGKTFTMQGLEQTQEYQGLESEFSGIIPRLVKSLFKKTKMKSVQRTFTISVSYLQLYNEKIFDLLNPASLNPKNIDSKIEGLRLRWNKNQQFTVENLFVFECKNSEELLNYFAYGLNNRITSSHKLNMTSSRSHSILTIKVQSFEHSDPNRVLVSKIQLVDLAGSERLNMTGNEGRQAKQSIDINKSLFTLRQVITNLAEAQKNKNKEQLVHIPYRQSKLTSILKQSIGGNSYCLMLACISPNDEFYDQNISTLAYATKATYITNKPVVNDDPRTKMIAELKSQIENLNSQLDKANKHIQLITQLNKPSESPTKLRPIAQISRMIPQVESPRPKIKKMQSEKMDLIGPNYDQFSERLIESINMVRQLLKSNKQLRQKLQYSTKRIQQKDIQIFELSRQNQRFREMFTTEPEQDFNFPKKMHTPKKFKNLATTHVPTINQSTNMRLEKTYNTFNTQGPQYNNTETIIDSVPTNFNRRDLATLPAQRKHALSYNQNPNLDKQELIDKYRNTVTSILNKKSVSTSSKGESRRLPTNVVYENYKGSYY